MCLHLCVSVFCIGSSECMCASLLTLIRLLFSQALFNVHSQTPPQLQMLFEKNYDLLLSIFNPQVLIYL